MSVPALQSGVLGRCALAGQAVWRVLAVGVVAGLMAWATSAPNAQRMLQSAKTLGPGAQQEVAALLAMLERLNLSELERALDDVNRFFNRRVAFKEDRQVWAQADYWASPLETLSKGAGDCEDFAISKYLTLLAAGVPAERMRLVYVRARIGGPSGPSQAHMVLAYYAQPQAEPLILDNLIDEIRPASRRSDLTPVFSFNTEGLWQGVGTVPAGDPVARLSRWREVLLKASQEGFLP